MLENSNVDKVYEYNGTTVYSNIVVPVDWIEEEYLSVSLVKKGRVALCFILNRSRETFDLEGQLCSRFGFEEPWDPSAKEERTESLEMIEKQEGLSLDYITFLIADLSTHSLEECSFKEAYFRSLKIQQESRRLEANEWRQQ